MYPPNFHQISEGQQVEVNRERGVWYSASILKYPSKSSFKKRRKALVEFKTLHADDGFSSLTEDVDPTVIRPLPPRDYSANGVFKENDIVDARYKGGWWAGVVKILLPGRRYIIYFEILSDALDFDAQELRLHWDWVDGVWVPPKLPQITGSAFSSGTVVEVNLDRENVHDAWFQAVVIRENGDQTYFVKRIGPNNDDRRALKVTVDSLHIRPIPPHYADRDYKMLDKVDVTYDFGWRAGVIIKLVAGRRYNVFFKHENEDKELGHSEIRPHADWLDGKWVTTSQGGVVVNQGQLGVAQSGNDYRECTNNKRQKFVELDTHAPVDAAGADKSTRVEVPIIVGLEAVGKGCLHPGKRQQKNLNDLIGEKNVEHDMLKSGGGGGQGKKRKCGRPCKIVGKAPEVSVAGMEDHASNGSELPVHVVVESNVVENEPGENTGVSDAESMTKDADEAFAGVPKDLADDDKPLPTWCGGIHSPTSAEDSRLSSGEAATRLDETRERQVVPLESCSVNAKGNSPLTGNQIQITPFKKNSSVWKTIETLEVFQTVPQNPHFHPLSVIKEEYREEAAIGIMYNFSHLVEKIRSLQFENPRSIFDSHLESLAVLETHGFDVVMIRDRVNELLSMKAMEGEVLNELKDTETQVKEHTVVRSVLDVVNDIEKKIMELPKGLTSAKSKVEAMDHEISELQTSADAGNRRMNKARHDFEKLATAPWKIP